MIISFKFLHNRAKFLFFCRCLSCRSPTFRLSHGYFHTQGISEPFSSDAARHPADLFPKLKHSTSMFTSHLVFGDCHVSLCFSFLCSSGKGGRGRGCCGWRAVRCTHQGEEALRCVLGASSHGSPPLYVVLQRRQRHQVHAVPWGLQQKSGGIGNFWL